MIPQNGNCANYMQLIQSLWAKSSACTLYWYIVYWRDFLPTMTGSAVYIWRNSLVFHFAGSSIYSLFIYGLHLLI